MKITPDYKIDKTPAVYGGFAVLWFLVLLGILLPIVSILSFVLEGSKAQNDWWCTIIILLPCCATWAYFSLTLIKRLSIKVWFEEEGIRLKCFGEPQSYILWRELQQVCICYSGYSTRGPHTAQTVLVCVKAGEKKNDMMRWKTDNFLHFRNVVTMEFTPELYQKIAEVCPLEIIDLRNTPEYRL